MPNKNHQTAPRHSRRNKLSSFLKLERRHRWSYFFVLLTLCFAGLLHAQSQPQRTYSGLDATPSWPYRITQHAPHDTEHFTQGLIVGTHSVIESSGLYGQSFVQKYNRKSGESEVRYTLPKTLFAEGIALYEQQLYLLTWKSRRGFVLDATNLQPLREFRFKGQGWGLTRLGEHLLMSNGSSEITWHRPSDFKQLNTTLVRAGQTPIDNINALSYGGGYLWANIWRQATILAISPETGQIKGKLNLDELWEEQAQNHKENVLNGLSWDESEQALWVTGKRWSQRYLLDIDIPKK